MADMTSARIRERHVTYHTYIRTSN